MCILSGFLSQRAADKNVYFPPLNFVLFCFFILLLLTYFWSIWSMDFAFDLRTYIAPWYSSGGHIFPMCYVLWKWYSSKDYRLSRACVLDKQHFQDFPWFATNICKMYMADKILWEKNCQKIRKWPIWNEMRSVHEDIKSGGARI